MNKNKLTDPRDNNIENKKEDYTDGNGNPEEFIKDMTDPEATDIFKEAFYAEGKALEEEALRSPFVEDEEKKETLRLRILAAAGRSEDESRAKIVAHEAEAVETEEIHCEAKAVVNENVDPEKKKKRKFTPLVRWVAVLALVCVGVFGVSMTSQAKGSGLWSSIQRLIGVETRWEHEDNGEDRTYTNSEEEKAISDIEEKLGIEVPIFFYWPNKLEYVEGGVVNNEHSFLMVYQKDNETVFFEGYCDDYDISTIKVWEGKGITYYKTYDGIKYTISEIINDNNEEWHYVTWIVDDIRFVLSGTVNKEEVDKILKNIKN